MARYYLLCEGTASLNQQSRRSARHQSTWDYCFPKAAPGFLFHDTESDLNPADLRRPLHTLLEIYDKGKEVFLVRINNKTLFASFSLAGIPHPFPDRRYAPKHRDILRSEGEKYTEGFLLQDATDPTSEIKRFKWNDLYENCERLERFTDSCPCPAAGYECKEEILPRVFDVPVEVLRTDYGIPAASTLKRIRYKNIAGFEYISGALTTSHDFMEALRPWDYHDFDCIDAKKAEYKTRGVSRKYLDQFRKEKCSVCCFAAGETSCGLEKHCPDSTDEATAWSNLALEYQHEGLGQQPNPRMQFTPEQVNYLIRHAGTEFRTNVMTGNRSITCMFAGFFRSGGVWQYAIAPIGRPYTRRKLFDSYEALYAATSNIAPATAVPKVEIPYNQRLAASILGDKSTFFKYADYSIKLDHDAVYLTTASDRWQQITTSLRDADTVDEYYRMSFGKRGFIKAQEKRATYQGV